MKQLVWILLIMLLVSSMTGCSRATRIVNDVDWIVFDGQPSKDN